MTVVLLWCDASLALIWPGLIGLAALTGLFLWLIAERRLRQLAAMDAGEADLAVRAPPWCSRDEISSGALDTTCLSLADTTHVCASAETYLATRQATYLQTSQSFISDRVSRQKVQLSVYDKVSVAAYAAVDRAVYEGLIELQDERL